MTLSMRLSVRLSLGVSVRVSPRVHIMRSTRYRSGAVEANVFPRVFPVTIQAIRLHRLGGCERSFPSGARL